MSKIVSAATFGWGASWCAVRARLGGVTRSVIGWDTWVWSGTSSPLSLVSVAQPDRHAVHQHDQHHQDEDPGRRQLLELGVGIRGPDEDLDRKGREVGERSEEHT